MQSLALSVMHKSILHYFTVFLHLFKEYILNVKYKYFALFYCIFALIKILFTC